jgi:hypothetical protein
MHHQVRILLLLAVEVVLQALETPVAVAEQVVAAQAVHKTVLAHQV